MSKKKKKQPKQHPGMLADARLGEHVVHPASWKTRSSSASSRLPARRSHGISAVVPSGSVGAAEALSFHAARMNIFAARPRSAATVDCGALIMKSSLVFRGSGEPRARRLFAPFPSDWRAPTVPAPKPPPKILSMDPAVCSRRDRR